MTLTSAEGAILVASFSVFSTLAGSVVTWRTTLTASREQWRRERADEHRQHRAEIYQEMVLAMDREIDLVKAHIRAGGGPKGAKPADQDLWKAKAVIFGSEEITAAWGRWTVVLDEGWDMTPGNVVPGQITDWQNRLRAASIALYDVMRAEVGTTGAPSPLRRTRVWRRLTRTRGA